MGEARFVFVSDHVDDTAGGAEPEHWTWWRLVAANNRVLGRSAGTYRGEDTCRAAAAELAKNLDDATQLVSVDARGRWTWTLSVGDVEYAQSAHPFPRRVDCLRTLTLMTNGLRVADPFGGALRVYSGTRSRAGQAPPAVTFATGVS